MIAAKILNLRTVSPFTRCQSMGIDRRSARRTNRLTQPEPSTKGKDLTDRCSVARIAMAGSGRSIFGPTHIRAVEEDAERVRVGIESLNALAAAREYEAKARCAGVDRLHCRYVGDLPSSRSTRRGWRALGLGGRAAFSRFIPGDEIADAGAGSRAMATLPRPRGIATATAMPPWCWSRIGTGCGRPSW